MSGEHIERLSIWEESAGRVSESFDEWFLIDGDQRAFLDLGLTFAQVSYERIWQQAGSEPGDPDGPEQIDIFEERVHGLHQHDFEWMHCSGVLRDAVTNFDVYLEKAREEMLRRAQMWRGVPEHAPFWSELQEFYKRLGVEIGADGVAPVRELRNFLTHRRGELRTEGLRKRYEVEDGPFGPLNVELSKATVLDAMDVLGAAVRRIDVTVYRHTWEGIRLVEA